MVLMIAYDLHEPVRTYEPVEKAIKSVGAWARAEESVWIVDTLMAPKEVLETVRAGADSNDTIFVGQLQQNWWSVNLTSAVVTWLKDPARRW